MRGFESHYPPHKKADDFCHWLFSFEMSWSFEEPNRPTGLSGFEREAAEAGALLTRDEITKSKRGIAV